MNRVLTPSLVNHSRTAFTQYSGLLSVKKTEPMAPSHEMFWQLLLRKMFKGLVTFGTDRMITAAIDCGRGGVTKIPY